MEAAGQVYATWLQANDNGILEITVVLYKLLAKAVESEF